MASNSMDRLRLQGIVVQVTLVFTCFSYGLMKPELTITHKRNVIGMIDGTEQLPEDI